MESSVKPVERKRLTQQIVDQLISLIVNGKLKTGDRLPTEHELMKQFGVGRSSLREATGALVLTGVLNARPGRGTYVNISADDFLSRTLALHTSIPRGKIEELIEARIALEQAIVGLAAAKADEQDIIELKQYHDQFKSLAEKGQRPAQIQADLSFHFTLAKAGHNSALYGYLSELRHLMQLWMKQTVRTESVYGNEAILKDHGDILSAVESHNVEQAQTSLRRHLETSANNLSIILLHKQLRSRVF
jgi:GntR family transcriptional repressor for pyruvate dehydrogenase complex